MEHGTMIMAAAAIIAIAAIAVAYIALSKGTALPSTTASTQQTSVRGSASAATTQSTTMATTTAAAPNSTNYTVRLSDNATLGEYLVNQTGFTLYLNSQDTPYSGKTACTGQCTYYWHPFYTPNLAVQPGLNQSKFGTMIRSDGSKQLTYYGYPIYTYIGDSEPGWVSGSGVAGFWNVVTYPHLST